jgi:hypothetical protein
VNRPPVWTHKAGADVGGSPGGDGYPLLVNQGVSGGKNGLMRGRMRPPIDQPGPTPKATSLPAIAPPG